MSHAPHTPLKNYVKELVAPKLGISGPKPGSGDPLRSSTYERAAEVDLGVIGKSEPGASVNLGHVGNAYIQRRAMRCWGRVKPDCGSS